ncbi:septin-7-like, partial [Antechinus flavipes]|uniref:septin-7-like n=1 Tax=Antechinus flavipes TaxID=38775 RepID=UPI002235DB11
RRWSSASESFSFCTFSLTFISNTCSISISIFFILATCSLLSSSIWARGLLVSCPLFLLLPVIDYIDSKFEDYLNAESRVNRRQMPDNRVQCCLYFIAPSGHGLKPLDIEFMKCLHDKVNVIPLIAKADTLTPEECQQFKKQIMKEIQEHKIKIYEFPETDDEEENKLVKKIKDRLPLAVVGSNTIIEVNGKRVRGRQYPWGVAEVENGDHCHFTILRNMLIRTHMQDLKDVTNNVHYENYRSRKLAALTYNGVDNNKKG